MGDEVKMPPQIYPLAGGLWGSGGSSDFSFREVEVSEAYKEEIRAVMEKMRSRGADFRKFNLIHYAGYSGGGFQAAVNSNNILMIQNSLGMDPLDLEWMLAHEWRHQRQNDAIWDGIVRRHGFKTSTCPLQCAYSGKPLPSAFVSVWNEYQRAIANGTEESRFCREMDAETFGYDYYKKYLAKGADAAQKIIILEDALFRFDLYFANMDEALKNGFAPNRGEKKIIEKAQKARKEILKALQHPKNEKEVRRLAETMDDYAQRVYAQYSGELTFDTSKQPYSLRERLFTLSPAAQRLAKLNQYAKNLENGGSFETLFAPVIKDTYQKFCDLDDLLNRQTLGYHRQFADPNAHTLYYRNDIAHNVNGTFRPQWMLE